MQGYNRKWEQCLTKTTMMRRHCYSMFEARKKSVGWGQSMLFYMDLSHFFAKNRADDTPHIQRTRSILEESPTGTTPEEEEAAQGDPGTLFPNRSHGYSRVNPITHLCSLPRGVEYHHSNCCAGMSYRTSDHYS